MLQNRSETILLVGVLSLIFFITGLVVGYNRFSEMTMSQNNLINHNMADLLHVHERRDVDEPYPAIAMGVMTDTKMGWNINLQTENFSFAPANVNTEYRAGEGHAHLYVNGERITRLYGPWYYLKELPSGDNTITVILSGNDHSELYVDNEIISASVSIFVE